MDLQNAIGFKLGFCGFIKNAVVIAINAANTAGDGFADIGITTFWQRVLEEPVYRSAIAVITARGHCDRAIEFADLNKLGAVFGSPRAFKGTCRLREKWQK